MTKYTFSYYDLEVIYFLLIKNKAIIINIIIVAIINNLMLELELNFTLISLMLINIIIYLYIINYKLIFLYV